MLTRIPEVLDAAQVASLRVRLENAGGAWVDGRATAGHQGAQVKRNLQIAEDCALARELGQVVLGALERNPLFISAALPNRVYPPLFNRYESEMHFGSHVDGAVRIVPGSAIKMRTDLSATLFLSAPEDYDGGELLIEDAAGMQKVKLPAGEMVDRKSVV